MECNMPGPKFFILTATLDRADRLSQAIASVRSQTYADWELFVLDDGSADETPAVLERESDVAGRQPDEPEAARLVGDDRVESGE